jgi:hypothetical protein
MAGFAAGRRDEALPRDGRARALAKFRDLHASRRPKISARPSHRRWLAGARMLRFQMVEHCVKQIADRLGAGRNVLAAAAVGVNPIEERIVEAKKALFHAAGNIIDNSDIKCSPRLLHTRDVCEHTRLCDHHGGLTGSIIAERIRRRREKQVRLYILALNVIANMARI